MVLGSVLIKRWFEFVVRKFLFSKFVGEFDHVVLGLRQLQF